MNMIDKVYKTKVDMWAWPILALTILSGPTCLLAGGWVLLRGGDVASTWVLLGTGVLMVAVSWLLCWPINYTLTADTLIVRFGVVRSRVPYEKIKEVYPTRNLLSSPAWSLDRLWVDYGTLFVMISPEDKDAFMTELASRASHLHLEDGKLQRSEDPGEGDERG